MNKNAQNDFCVNENNCFIYDILEYRAFKMKIFTVIVHLIVCRIHIPNLHIQSEI